ncbi:trypsin-like peptidase domain-containing protein [Actinomycetospora lutea]|uniref:nSTAND1 domain-containing NTPase n=1 Tax=Actinomycetospora lutea TaxID=663604 RepID=UPI002366B17D|nr:trypsin-like peptidase domain-containing protein [Actinomycetospora lutea]MDD7936981.1 trypsin-like peptidase domain-containing protein [Actinomycetospora lutea]
MLQRTADARRIPDLIAEILNHPKSRTFHSSIYGLLGDSSSIVDAKRALRHGLDSLSENQDSFGDHIRAAAPVLPATPVGSLEAITSPPSGLGDPKAYAQAIMSATRRIAMIEVHGRPRGTGILVGPDLLLTAAHVLDSRHWPPSEPIEVVAVFDYLSRSGRSPAETGTRVSVSEFLCGSLPTESEANGDVLDWEAPSNRLDFALLRLASRVPDAPEDPLPRGHYTLRPEPYAFDQAPLLFIVQHPLGEFQAISYIRQAPQCNDNGTRIRYRANTLLGSSGSPVIDAVGRLVAVHHYSTTGTNQAVPVSKIAQSIMAGPCAPLLDTGSGTGSVRRGEAIRITSPEELQRCVVGLSREGGEQHRTGFLIAPSTILTTKHSLTDSTVGAPYKVSLGGREFPARVTFVPKELDVAVLEASEPSQHWLRFDRSPAIGDRTLAFGFPGGHPKGKHFRATIEGPTEFGGTLLLTFHGEKSTEDFSGAPLFNLDRNGVCGIVTSTGRDQLDTVGWAVPVASVLEVLPSVRELGWRHNTSEPHGGNGHTSTNEKIDLLAREVLAGDAILIVGDVLDSATNLGRTAVDRYVHQHLSRIPDRELKRIALLNYLRSESRPSSKSYETIPKLPFTTVVSLHPDAQLEQALYSYRAVTLGDDLRQSELGVGKRDLYLFGGSVLFGKGLILNQDDRDDLRERYNRLNQGFRVRLAMAPILLLGCKLATDWTIRRLLHDILRHRTPLDGKIFVASNPSDCSPVLPGEFTVIDASPEELLLGLQEAIAGRRPLRLRTWVDTFPKHTGFRYLDHFTEDDRSVFFAREQDCEALLQVVLSSPSKISVLCGRSGAGKTSLVLAGLQPLLHSQTHMRVKYLRSTADPLQMLERALIEMLDLGSGYSISADPSFERLKNRLAGLSSPILFIIDQLEEAFVKGGKEETRRFLAAIDDLLALNCLPARFLFVAREDFLHELAGDRTSSKSTLASVYRLADFDHADASAVVRQTATAMGWECEPGFLRAMLEDLSPDRILPVHLQIVCHRIQQESTHLAKFDASTYHRLGRASTILRNHVDHALEGLSGSSISQIRSVLAAMVTSRDTKFLLTDEQIAGRSGLPLESVSIALLELIHEFRLVREVQLDQVRYELAHESLVSAVLEWLDASDHNLRIVQDIIDQDVVLARRDPSHVISTDRLSLIEAVLDELDMGEDALSLVASSFCVTGSIPTAILDRIAQLSERQQVESLWVRPVASDPHQFEAVLRSAVSEALPEYDASDLPDTQLALISEAIQTGDAQILVRLLRFLRLTTEHQTSILERVASGGIALRSLADSALPDSLLLLARYAAQSSSPKVPSRRLGLRLILEHIDRQILSADAASDCIACFVSKFSIDIRRADAIRVVSEFLADGLGPRNPTIFGPALRALASKGRRPMTGDRLLTDREAVFVQDAVATAHPSQAIAICGALLGNLLDSDQRQLPSLNSLGRFILARLASLSGGRHYIDRWLSRDLAGARLFAGALSWSVKLPEFREMPPNMRFSVERAIEEFNFGPTLTYRLNEVILSGWDILPSNNTASAWRSEPTEDELEEIEEWLGVDLNSRLLEDVEELIGYLDDLELQSLAAHTTDDIESQVPELPRFDADVQAWGDHEQRDADLDISNEEWRNFAREYLD